MLSKNVLPRKTNRQEILEVLGSLLPFVFLDSLEEATPWVDVSVSLQVVPDGLRGGGCNGFAIHAKVECSHNTE